MRRSFKFLLRPTVKRAAALAQCLEDHRQLYNAALEHRRTAFRKAGVTVRYGEQSAELKHIRADDPDGQARWSFSSQQATLRRLDKAYAAFFKRVREGRAPGFPRFKGRGWFDTVDWPKDGDGCRWDSRPEHPTTTYVRLQGIGHIRVHQHRPVRGTVKTISVKREGSRSNRRRKVVSQLAALHAKVRAVLAHKAESAGRELIAVNPANTSRTCARCGHCARENRPTQAEFACTACGHAAHADVNAATNILRAGLALRRAEAA